MSTIFCDKATFNVLGGFESAKFKPALVSFWKQSKFTGKLESWKRLFCKRQHPFPFDDDNMGAFKGLALAGGSIDIDHAVRLGKIPFNTLMTNW